MKHGLLAISVSLLLSGCATNDKNPFDVSLKHLAPTPNALPPVNLVVAPDLLPDYQAFIETAVKQHVTLNSRLRNVELVDSIDTNNPNGRTIGLCTVASTNDGQVAYRDVQIVKDVANDPILLRVVMFHELGHCLLSLEHTGTENKQIMDAIIDIDDAYAVENWDSLVNFEFNSVK